MFDENVKRAILAIVDVDRQATDEDRAAIRNLLDGDRHAATMSLKDAGRILNVTFPTVKRMIDAGRLSPVMSSNGRRFIGVTAESVYKAVGR